MRAKNPLAYYDPAMLELMRRHAYSWLTRAVLGLIVVVFIFWGIGSGFLSQVHPVATVDGNRVLADEVDKEANQIRQTFQQMYGPSATEILKTINLRQEALQRIIENRLIAQEARHIGVRVSDQALEQKIASQAAFQSDGQFDFTRYQDVLASNNIDPNEFESSMRVSLLQQALRNMIDQAVQISPEAAHNAYNLQNQRIQLAYFEVPFQDFSAKIAPTAAQLEDYYKKHSEDFREPERATILYIHYDPVVLAAKVTPTDKEVDDYYKRNLNSRFTHPDMVSARHILVAVSNGATDAEKAKARAKADDLLAQLKKGADFAKLAEQNSDDTGTRSKGGDLGPFGKGQMIKPFEDAAFSMRPGEVSIVETKFGFHIVRLDSISPAHVDTLADAKAQIVEMLRSQAGARMAREALDQDVSSAISGTDLKELAKKRGLEAVQTAPSSRQEALASIRDGAVVKAAFQLEPGQSQGVASGQSPFLIKLIAKEPSRIPPLKDIESKVREVYIRNEAESQARAKAHQLLGQIKSAADFDSVAASNKYNIHKTDSFNRSTNSVPGLGSLPEVTQAASTVPSIPGVIDRVIENEGNSYLFEVLARSAPSDEDWKDAERNFTEELLQQRRAEAWQQFIDQLKSKAKITVDPNQLGQTAPEPSL